MVGSKSSLDFPASFSPAEERAHGSRRWPMSSLHPESTGYSRISWKTAVSRKRLRCFLFGFLRPCQGLSGTRIFHKWKIEMSAHPWTGRLFAQIVPRPPNQLLSAHFYLRGCQHSTFTSSSFTWESQSPTIYRIHLLGRDLYQIKCLITKVTNSSFVYVCVVCVCVCCSPSKYFNPVISLPCLVTWFLFCFFMAGCVYVTALLHWYKHAPHSKWINVRRTAGSLCLPVTSYPAVNVCAHSWQATFAASTPGS